MFAWKNKHSILVSGPDFDHCKNRVLHFLEKSALVSYDRIEIIDNKCVRGDSDSFTEKLDLAVSKNKAAVSGFISELEDSGVKSLRDFLAITEGYQSKIFHTIAHLIDGFFGIDSVFYNLEDDSNGVSDILRKAIAQGPTKFWLIELLAYSESTDKASFIHSTKNEKTK